MLFFILWLCSGADEKLMKCEAPAGLGNHSGMQSLSAIWYPDPRLEKGGQGSKKV